MNASSRARTAAVCVVLAAPLAVTAPSPAFAASNGLTNGDFDLGTAGWVASTSGTVFSVGAHDGRDSGAGAVLYAKTSGAQASITDTDDLVRGLAVGDTVSATVDLRAGGGGVRGRLALRFFVDGVYTRAVYKEVDLTSSWTSVTVTGVADAANTSVDARVLVTGATSKAKAYADRVGLSFESGLAGQDSVSTPGETRDVVLAFDGGDSSTLHKNSGWAPVTSTVLRSGSGDLTVAEDRYGASAAGRLPAYGSGMAVVRLASASNTTDTLDPGVADFAFGSDVRIDSTSEGSTSDNGNNVIQRGLWNGASQWKLQVDANRPSCRVKGAAGAVSVSAAETLVPGRWYSLRCERTGSAVTLRVTDLTSGVTTTRSATGATGDMTPSSASVPMSVGGKLRDDGTLMTGAGDQFNGVLDNAFLDILR